MTDSQQKCDNLYRLKKIKMASIRLINMVKRRTVTMINILGQSEQRIYYVMHGTRLWQWLGLLKLLGEVIACNIKSRASCINLKIGQNSNLSWCPTQTSFLFEHKTSHLGLKIAFMQLAPAYCSPLLFAGHSIFALSSLSFNFLNRHTAQFANGHPLSNQGFSTLITDRAGL